MYVIAVSAIVDKVYIDENTVIITNYLNMKRREREEEKRLAKYIPVFRGYVEDYMRKHNKKKITEQEAEILARNFASRIK